MSNNHNLDELKKLGDLYKSGVLNEEEFTRLKTELLGSQTPATSAKNKEENTQVPENAATQPPKQNAPSNTSNEQTVKPEPLVTSTEKEKKQVSNTSSVPTNNAAKVQSKPKKVPLFVWLILAGLVALASFFYYTSKKSDTNTATLPRQDGPYGHSIAQEKARQDSLNALNNTSLAEEESTPETTTETLSTSNQITIAKERVYFFEDANSSIRSSRYLLQGETVTIMEEKDGFVKASFRHNGDEITGWLKKSDLEGYSATSGSGNSSNNLQESTDEIFTIVEEYPSFPGGNDALKNYLTKNLQFPQDEIDAGADGRCVIRFVVEKDGSVSNVQLIKGFNNGPACDKEAQRVIKQMPKWKAGRQQNKEVRTLLSLPISLTPR